jgi:hypothetical protein
MRFESACYTLFCPGFATAALTPVAAAVTLLFGLLLLLLLLLPLLPLLSCSPTMVLPLVR